MLLLHYAQVLCQYRLCRTDHAYLTYLMLQRLPNHLSGRKLDHRQVQASLYCRTLPYNHFARTTQKT
jgi:hypothetical protein